MKTPFDALCLAAVVAELQPWLGAKLQRVVQPGPLTIVLGFYGRGEAWLLLSADPRYARAHLVARRPGSLKPLPPFCTELRQRLDDALLVFARQRGLDRVLELGLSGPEGDWTLVAELMGKHANLMLVRADRVVVTAAKWVGPGKSQRPVLPMRPYEPPPFAPRPSILEAGPGDDLASFEGASPFLLRLIAAGTTLDRVQRAFRDHDFEPVYAEGSGAYPLPLTGLVRNDLPRSSVSQGLEQHFEGLIEAEALLSARGSLRTQLERVRLAREVALRDVDEALAAARDANAIQRRGELILAYQGQIRPGDAVLEAWDYDGEPIAIPLRPELTPVENAQRVFEKAKRAKNRAEAVADQRGRLGEDLAKVSEALERLEKACTVAEVEALRQEADGRKWLHRSGAPLRKEERPYEGHAIRELVSPGGWAVLYGENATANDFLTTKVARPSDLWFHVRGAPSTHVVLRTHNQPQKVQRPDIEFAARLAVRHSAAKHSSYVSVDYTQRRYVRKPRGSAPGTAVYDHETTLHVEGV